MLNREASLPASSTGGNIIYTLIYSISKELKEAKEEVVKPVRSAPLYEESFLRFKVVREAITREVNGRRITFDLKIFEDSNLICHQNPQPKRA